MLSLQILFPLTNWNEKCWVCINKSPIVSFNCL